MFPTISEASFAFLNPVVLNRFLKRETVERFARKLRQILMMLSVVIMTTSLYFGAHAYLGAQAHIADRALIALRANQLASASSVRGKRNRPSTDVIVSRNVFGDLQPSRSVSPVVAPPAKPKIPLALIGTFMTGPTTSHYAIIEHTKRAAQDVFAIGDSVFEDATVTDIGPEQVTIKRNNGEIEILALDDTTNDSGGAGTSGAPTEQLVVDKAELDGALANLPLLLTQARAVPYFKDGKSVGLRLFAIKSGSMFEKIGLRNGDILKNINGSSMSDITQAVKLFEQLKEERSISVLVERNREERELQYQIR